MRDSLSFLAELRPDLLGWLEYKRRREEQSSREKIKQYVYCTCIYSKLCTWIRNCEHLVYMCTCTYNLYHTAQFIHISHIFNYCLQWFSKLMIITRHNFIDQMQLNMYICMCDICTWYKHAKLQTILFQRWVRCTLTLDLWGRPWRQSVWLCAGGKSCWVPGVSLSLWTSLELAQVQQRSCLAHSVATQGREIYTHARSYMYLP